MPPFMFTEWMVSKSDNVQLPPFGTRSEQWYREYHYPTVIKGYLKDLVDLGEYGDCKSMKQSILNSILSDIK